MPVPNHPLAAVRKPQAPHGGEECISLHLDRLGQRPTGAVAQNGRQRVVDRIGLTEGTTVLSLIVTYRSFGRLRQASTHLDTPPL